MLVKEPIMQLWWLIAVSITSGVAGQTSMKIGLGQLNGSAQIVGIPSVIMVILTSPLVLLGLSFYVLGALTWIIVLSRLNLSYAYPFLALNFVLITLVSWLVLGEAIPITRWFGIVCICVGVVLVARSAL